MRRPGRPACPRSTSDRRLAAHSTANSPLFTTAVLLKPRTQLRLLGVDHRALHPSTLPPHPEMPCRSKGDRQRPPSPSGGRGGASGSGWCRLCDSRHSLGLPSGQQHVVYGAGGVWTWRLAGKGYIILLLFRAFEQEQIPSCKPSCIPAISCVKEALSPSKQHSLPFRRTDELVSRLGSPSSVSAHAAQNRQGDTRQPRDWPCSLQHPATGIHAMNCGAGPGQKPAN